MHRLAAALSTLCERMGVVRRYGERVAEIRVERGRAAGVTLESGEVIEAPRIVCAADPAAIGAGDFGRAASRASSRVGPRRRSLSAMVWTANAVCTGFPLARHNVFFSTDYRAEFDALRAGRLADAPTVYLCAQDRGDAGGAQPGAERIQIIVNAPATGDGAPLTEQEIERCRRQMLDGVSRAGLSLDLGTQAVLTTPHDFARLCPSTGGALYGPASHGWAASFRRQGSRTSIPGLYCAGGSTHPGAGVPMAALSGRLAAECLAQDRVSTSWWHRRAMPGGMSTRPATAGATG
jgi:1-hydroxycarotenoid 3,4-desaturase